MTPALDYLDHLAHESDLFAAAVAAAPPDRPVPSCPEWTTTDLIWHLAEVQWFWAAIVRERLDDPSQLPAHPDRPRDVADLQAFGVQCSADLVAALASAPPGAPAWTWSTEQSVAFVLRRQAHEALIHRVDAELLVEDRHPMDPALCADGIDEALRIMFSPTREWADVTMQPDATLRLTATDTGDSWAVTLARFTGTDPEGTSYDDAVLVVADHDTGRATSATLSGTAADLDCWLWNRPTVTTIERQGNVAVLAGFDAVLSDGIQ